MISPNVPPNMRCLPGKLRNRWQWALDTCPLAASPGATWLAANNNLQ